MVRLKGASAALVESATAAAVAGRSDCRSAQGRNSEAGQTTAAGCPEAVSVRAAASSDLEVAESLVPHTPVSLARHDAMDFEVVRCRLPVTMEASVLTSRLVCLVLECRWGPDSSSDLDCRLAAWNKVPAMECRIEVERRTAGLLRIEDDLVAPLRTAAAETVVAAGLPSGSER